MLAWCVFFSFSAKAHVILNYAATGIPQHYDWPQNNLKARAKIYRAVSVPQYRISLVRVQLSIFKLGVPEVPDLAFSPEVRVKAYAPVTMVSALLIPLCHGHSPGGHSLSITHCCDHRPGTIQTCVHSPGLPQCPSRSMISHRTISEPE